MIKTRTNLLFIFLLFASSFVAYGQGSTTSGINGRINTDGETLPGATVLAVHVPTGTQFGTITDKMGYYHFPNLDVGGPYKVSISFVGYSDYVKNNVYLTLGQNLQLNVNLKKSDVMVEEVLVTADKHDLFDGNKTGAETVISEEIIQQLPSVSGDLNDFTRLTPQASMVGGGISIAGANNRYNSVFIDGAVNNDVFGLSPNGMNGGQTGISAISIETIEQFQVVIAPYDVRQGGFSGGGINAVTKSGTNAFKGMVYYKYRNQNLAGKTPDINEGETAEKLPDFVARTVGVNLGGPIIKNKLFFFVNAEMQRDETPRVFDFSKYEGDADKAKFLQLENKLINDYSYDPGGFETNTNELNGNKILMRMDWNINKKHKLMLRHQYTYAEVIQPNQSFSNDINYYNSGVYFPSTTNSTALELKSRFGANIVNKLIVGYTSVHDDRDQMGDPFPYVSITDGAASIEFGSERYSTANELNQSIFTITDNFQIYKGKHTFTIGTHNEFYKLYNLFIRKAFGEYQYSSIDQFLNNESANRYIAGYSLVDDVVGDGSEAAADFSAMQLGFYVQDEYQVSDRLKLTAGLRFDVPIFSDKQTEAPGFNDVVITKLEAAGYDLKGAKSGKMPKSQLMFSPRVGFNWDVTGDKSTQIRGGVGIFTSRVPLVWPSGAYINCGGVIGSVDVKQNNVGDIEFVPEWDKQPTITKWGGTDPVVSGQIDLFSEDFKFPQVLRTSIAVDQKFPMGIIGSVEIMLTKTLNNVSYEDLNVLETGNATGTPDNRPLFDQYANESAYGQIMLGSNTNKGYAFNFTAQLRKSFKFGLFTSISYTYGKSRSIFDGTSSQNSSQWNYLVSSPVSKNKAALSISDFDMKHRVVTMLAFKKTFLKHLTTSISLFYNGQSGSPFSYIYNDYYGNFTGEGYKSPQLIYIPNQSSDIIFGGKNADGNLEAFGANSTEQLAMWQELEGYINQDDYLSEHKGEYAERNGARLPWENVIDFRFAQDVFVNVGGRKQTLQFTFDIFNLGNMLNSDWGHMHTGSNINLIKYEGMIDDTTTPIFSFSRPDDDEPWYIDDSGFNSSRWQAQIGIRYIF